MPAGDTVSTVLHYAGYDDDRGGIVSLVGNLAATGRSDCVLGMNAGCRRRRAASPRILELPPLAGERIGLLNLVRARAAARAVQAWLRAEPGRVFHGHSRAGLLVALWLCRWGERRTAVSVHCYGRQRWFYRWAARRLGDRLFWLSPAMRDYYGMAGVGWDRCIPGGVPPSGVAPAAPVPGRLRLGGVGALVPWKNWRVVLRALALLTPGERAKITFSHIGEGPVRHRAALLELAQRLGVGGQVEFRGHEPTSDKLLGEIDALAIVSENEPFSVGMLEALAAGVPVLAADTGGARDLIRDGVNGRLHPTGEAGALATQLAEWLSAPPSWDRKKIRATTVWADDIARQWADVYAVL